MLSKLSLATLLSAMAFAAGAATTPSPAKPTEPAKEKEKLVCTTEHKTGSHLPKRVCLTQSARDERAKRDQDAMRSLRDKQPRSPGG